MTIYYIIASTFIISLISFVGAFALVLKEKALDNILLVLVALSAGGLIGGAFLHLLPEAIKNAGNTGLAVFLYLIIGFCVFFIMEQFLRWHHCHKTEHSHDAHTKPLSYLILISDGIHNAIDGLVIAASFVASPALGIATCTAVVLHEIPQEFGDFGVLVYSGMKPKKALTYNFISGLTAILGGIAGYYLVESVSGSILFLIPFAAGNFIYIACSDLIPEIQYKDHLGHSLLYFFIFIIGISLMFLLRGIGL